VYFSSIPPTLGRSHARPNSMTSNPSIRGRASPSISSGETNTVLQLNQIIAVYKLEDGRPYSAIEVAFLDEESSHASSISLQLTDPREADIWLVSIRAASQKSRILDPVPFPNKTVDFVVRRLEASSDYDRANFKMFRAVQRATNKGQGRSGSVDDLGKMSSSICYVAIGAHKVHLIPVPKSSSRTSSASVAEIQTHMQHTSYGILTLTGIYVQSMSDTLDLTFR
jgi:hypothetical protein